MKKVILRKDLVTGKMLPTNELIRVVKTKDGQILVDQTKKLNGRGVYLKPDLKGVEVVKKKKLIQKSLRTEVDANLFEQLKVEIETNWD